MKLLTTVLVSLVLTGCLTTASRRVNKHQDRIDGDAYLVAIAEGQKTVLERHFKIVYTKNIRIFWSDYRSLFEPRFNQIRINRAVKGTPAQKEHVRHELTEAMCWEATGGYPEGKQPQRLNGKWITDIVPSWSNHYR